VHVLREVDPVAVSLLRLRVVTDASTRQGVIDDSFDRIRQAALSDTSVSLRLLEAIEAVAHHMRDGWFRRALRRQAEMIYHGSQEGLKETLDRKDAEERYHNAVEVLDGKADIAPPAEVD
jgi:uncharacterized membrane protein